MRAGGCKARWGAARMGCPCSGGSAAFAPQRGGYQPLRCAGVGRFRTAAGGDSQSNYFVGSVIAISNKSDLNVAVCMDGSSKRLDLLPSEAHSVFAVLKLLSAHGPILVCNRSFASLRQAGVKGSQAALCG